jgi:hypothetical protein
MPSETKVDRDLLLEFFLSFSRFEYALKTTGFYKRRPEDSMRPPAAEPDWDRFATSLRDTFQRGRDRDLENACASLLDPPPNRQVIINDAPAWETPTRGPGSEVEFLLRMVRTVRNNLFHGGKYSNDVHEPTKRTELLLRSSLVILRECLALSPVQEAAYLQAKL